MNARAHGFTLIELLVVVALIGVMSAIAVPSFASFISNYRVTAAVNEVMQGITVVRAEALKRGRKVTMLPNQSDAARTPGVGGNWVYGWTIFVDLNNNQILDTGDTVIYKHPDLSTSITVTAAGAYTTPFANANYVIFDGTGYPRTSASTQLSGGIVLTDRINATSTANIRTLCLANIGRPRIVKGTDSCVSG